MRIGVCADVDAGLASSSAPRPAPVHVLEAGRFTVADVGVAGDDGFGAFEADVGFTSTLGWYGLLNDVARVGVDVVGAAEPEARAPAPAPVLLFAPAPTLALGDAGAGAGAGSGTHALATN